MKVRIRNWRHRNLERLRHSEQTKEWFKAQSTRLNVTEDDIVEMLTGGATFETIESMAAPEPEEG